MSDERLNLDEYPLEVFADPLGREPGSTLAGHITVDELAIVRKASPRLFAALYQQTPRAQSGRLIDPRHFVKVTMADLPDDHTIKWVRFFDLAYTGKQVAKATPDYSATAKLGLFKKNAEWYLILQSISRWQQSWPETKRHMIEIINAEGHRLKYGVEANGPQKAVYDELKTERKLQGYKLVGLNPVADKVARAQPWIDFVETGRFLVIDSPAIKVFADECEAFNVGRYDDQVDAVSGAHFMLSRYMNRRSVSTVRVRGLYT